MKLFRKIDKLNTFESQTLEIKSHTVENKHDKFSLGTIKDYYEPLGKLQEFHKQLL